MKQIFTYIFTAILLVTSSNIFAQKKDYDVYFPKSEIFVQYGLNSYLEYSDQIRSLNKTMTNKGFEIDNFKYSGALALGYNFSLNENVSLGASIGFSNKSQSLYNSAKVRILDLQTDTYTALLSGNLQYFRGDNFDCTGSIYLGYAYLNETAKNIVGQPGEIEADRGQFAYHFTLVRARYGGTFGAYLELGYGYRGLISAGLSIRL